MKFLFFKISIDISFIERILKKLIEKIDVTLCGNYTYKSPSIKARSKMKDKPNITNYVGTFKNSLRWRYILIHHSLTKDGKVSDWEAIKRYHVIKNKWDDIGYHFGIESVNDVLEYKIGRPLSVFGAHEPVVNRNGIGICVIGNYDVVAPTEKHYFMTAYLCKMLMLRFDISIENILPHSYFTKKTCPGKLYDMRELYKLIITGFC